MNTLLSQHVKTLLNSRILSSVVALIKMIVLFFAILGFVGITEFGVGVATVKILGLSDFKQCQGSV